MLSVRVFHLLAIGFCLFLIAKYMQFMATTVHGLDRLMMRRFFDVEELTDEIQARVERRHGCSPPRCPSQGIMCHAAYLWLCRRLRRAAGLDSGTD